jgi:pimeloyl-ACP methyl ester carboxylesterase
MQQPSTDLSGLGSLTIDAVTGFTDIIESLQLTIPTFSGVLGTPKANRKIGVRGKAFSGIRNLIETMGDGIDAPLEQFGSVLANSDSSPVREAALSILNGVLGDHLVKKSNPLAITMRFRQDGNPLDEASLRQVINQSSGKIAIMVHGSCMNDLQWNRNGHDHGAAIARDLGFEPIYLHYNSGRHISENGREFSELLETMTAQATQDLDIVIIAHSMGGLVSRSACYYAESTSYTWIKQLKKMVFLGTPHHGANLEKAGNWIDTILDATPYSAPFSRLGKIRSSGVTDLRFGNVIDADWKGRDRFELSGDKRTPVPLPESVKCYTIAATKGKKSSMVSDKLIGDGLVTLDSAMGRHKKTELNLLFPQSHQWLGRNMSHWSLLDHPDVYETLNSWLKD